MKKRSVWGLAVVLCVLSLAWAFGEGFMMRAVRVTMEGDAERIVQHLFPKAEFESVETLPTEEKFKEIHPRDMVVKMSGGLTVTLRLTGKVHRKNTGGLPYTIEVIDVSNVKGVRGKKKLAVLPDGAKKALADLKDVVKEKVSQVALNAYVSEKVESVLIGEFEGKHDERVGTATVKMSGGIQVVLSVRAGYKFDPKSNKIVSHVAGFEKAVYTKNGVADIPKNPIELIKK